MKAKVSKSRNGTRPPLGRRGARLRQSAQRDIPLTTKIVDELLFENKLWLQAIDEATIVGRLDEAVGYAEKVESQLLDLIKIADTQVFHCGPPPNEDDLLLRRRPSTQPDDRNGNVTGSVSR